MNSSANTLAPIGAPRSTVSPVAMPVAVSTVRPCSATRLRRPIQVAKVAVVCMSGGSGPMPPPAAMLSSETGISDRNALVEAGPP